MTEKFRTGIVCAMLSVLALAGCDCAGRHTEYCAVEAASTVAVVTAPVWVPVMAAKEALRHGPAPTVEEGDDFIALESSFTVERPQASEIAYDEKGQIVFVPFKITDKTSDNGIGTTVSTDPQGNLLWETVGRVGPVGSLHYDIPVWSVAMIPNDTRAIVVQEALNPSRGGVGVFDLADQRTLMFLPLQNPQTRVWVSGDGRYFAFIDQHEHQLYIYETVHLTSVAKLSLGNNLGDSSARLAFTRESSRLAILVGNTVYVFKISPAK